MRSLSISLLLLAAIAAGPLACGPPPAKKCRYAADATLTPWHVQSKGTHNSYHVALEGSQQRYNYSHRPLGEQLEKQGVRSFELDVNWIASTGELEVFHTDVLDDGTTCKRFPDCLAALSAWSAEHPCHQLLTVMIEPKYGFDTTTAEANFQRVEAQINAAFPAERLLTPAELTGEFPSVRASLDARGWPTLGATRGKTLFFITLEAELKPIFTHQGRDLAGRTMFAAGGVTDSWAAVSIVDDAKARSAQIASTAAAGLLVRTRADSENQEPLANDRSTLEAALASAAHVISTDYPVKARGTDYFVEIPGGTPSRCNPLTAPAECAPNLIEDPAELVPR
jgi:hypothetical protein